MHEYYSLSVPMVATRWLTGDVEQPLMTPAWNCDSFSGSCDVNENDKSNFQMPPFASCAYHMVGSSASHDLTIERSLTS